VALPTAASSARLPLPPSITFAASPCCASMIIASYLVTWWALSFVSCGPTVAQLVGHIGLELRNVVANYRFERWERFAGIQPNICGRSCANSEHCKPPSACVDRTKFVAPASGRARIFSKNRERGRTLRRHRREAPPKIFVVRCSLPCNPLVGVIHAPWERTDQRRAAGGPSHLTPRRSSHTRIFGTRRRLAPVGVPSVR
jgi:hypothetical protein